MRTIYQAEELTNPLLDFFVAKAEGGSYLRTEDNVVYKKTDSGRMFLYAPSTDWRLGGPIIEKHLLSVYKTPTGWRADNNAGAVADGATPLIAAMRARVIMEFGYVLEVDG